jgi:hypothetical protein
MSPCRLDRQVRGKHEDLAHRDKPPVLIGSDAAMFLLVTGASGAGKSTVRRLVTADLSPEVECVELHHVSSVPPFPTIAWRQQATEAAVQRAVELQAERRHLLLCGDPVAAGEVLAAPSAVELDGVAVCLLDLSPEAQASRLAGRGDDPALLADHHAFAGWMRGHARDPGHMPHVLSARSDIFWRCRFASSRPATSNGSPAPTTRASRRVMSPSSVTSPGLRTRERACGATSPELADDDTAILIKRRRSSSNPER